MSKYQQGTNCVSAIYSATYPRVSEGNPLIEALPSFSDEKELRKLLLNRIPYDQSERNLPAGDRLDAIGSIFHCFYALPFHMKLADSFKKAVKGGYIGRNPLNPEYNRALNQLSNCVKNKDSEFHLFTSTNSTTAGYSLIGVSGMGKTSSMNRVLNLYPQIIIHEKYKDQVFNFLQIVWMKIECPFDGGVKGLCGSFFRQFDELTNDNTYAKFANYNKATIDNMIPQMALIACRHGLGALIIDEIQNINVAQSGGKEKMLNFLKHLVNTIGVPVIVIGTPDSMSVLSGNIQDARRFSGEEGQNIMEPIHYNDPIWNIFLKSIWKFQWTNIETELTDEMSFAMHRNSGGIIGEAVKLYAFIQERAINRGRIFDEGISVDLIEETANSEKYFAEKKKIEQIYVNEQKIIESYKCNKTVSDEEVKVNNVKSNKTVNQSNDQQDNSDEFPVINSNAESCIKLMIECGNNGEELLRRFGLICKYGD